MVEGCVRYNLGIWDRVSFLIPGPSGIDPHVREPSLYVNTMSAHNMLWFLGLTRVRISVTPARGNVLYSAEAALIRSSARLRSCAGCAQVGRKLLPHSPTGTSTTG
jgi:hypothetical protein